MRRALFAIVVIAGCGKEADVVLEIHRASTSSFVSIDVCDEDRPEDCTMMEAVNFDADSFVHRVGIYLDDAITPPLGVWLDHSNPLVPCQLVELDPERESEIVVEFRAAQADLQITGCSTCDLGPCPAL